ncbi:FecR family protein [Pedobacter sp. PWIIR3]
MEQEYSKEKALLEKFNNGLAKPQEELQINAAFNQFAKTAAEDNREFNAREVGERIWSNLPPAQIPAKTIRMWPRIATIAAAVAAIAFGVYFFKYSNTEIGKQVQDDLTYKNDIAPGKQGATLTLANGKTIKLSDAANGKLAEQSGVTITKTADGKLIYEIKDKGVENNKINTLSTANGETYDLTLPDGTLVSLNAASSLAYPANFSALKERRVKLTGEGYFEVAKDKTHPFIVATATQEVQVLGTHFNINAYADEASVKTTLLEGSVKLSSLRGVESETSSGQAVRQSQNEAILKPNQQATLKAGEIAVKDVDTETAVDWKNGDFIFERESLASIMCRVARWYNIEVSYQGKIDVQQTFSGRVSRSQNISAVLKSLASTGLLQFKVNGKAVTVLENKNK